MYLRSLDKYLKSVIYKQPKKHRPSLFLSSSKSKLKKSDSRFLEAVDQFRKLSFFINTESKVMEDQSEIIE